MAKKDKLKKDKKDKVKETSGRPDLGTEATGSTYADGAPLRGHRRKTEEAGWAVLHQPPAGGTGLARAGRNKNSDGLPTEGERAPVS